MKSTISGFLRGCWRVWAVALVSLGWLLNTQAGTTYVKVHLDATAFDFGSPGDYVALDLGGAHLVRVADAMHHSEGLSNVVARIPLNQPFPVAYAYQGGRSGSFYLRYPACSGYDLRSIDYDSGTQSLRTNSTRTAGVYMLGSGTNELYLASTVAIDLQTPEGCCSAEDGGVPRLSADGLSRAKASLPGYPNAIFTNVVWSIEGDNLGCRLESDPTNGVAFVTAGETPGTLTLVATVTGECEYSAELELCGDSSVGCAGGSCASTFGSASLDNRNGPDIRFGLGANSVTRDNGFLWLAGDVASAALSAPAGLRLPQTREHYTVTRDAHGLLLQATANSGVVRTPEGAIRQVLTPQGLVDIVPTGAYAYQLRFYRGAPSALAAAGLYQVPGAAECVWTVENPNASTNNLNALRVTETRGGSSWIRDYTFANGQWTMVDPQSLARVVSSAETNTTAQPAYRAEYRETHAGTTLVAAESRRYEWIDNGYRLAQTTVGTNADARTTHYAYYGASDPPAQRFQLKQVDYPDGRWEIYEYDPWHRRSRVYSAWGNQPPTTNASLCRVIEYGYAGNLPGSDLSLEPGTPRQEVEKILGVEVARRYLEISATETEIAREQRVCLAPGDSWAAAGTTGLRTVGVSARWGENAGRPGLVRRPDGTWSFHQYEVGGDLRVETEDRGEPKAALTGILNGERIVTTTGKYGETLLRVVRPIMGGNAQDLLVASETYVYANGPGSDYTVTTLDGRTVSYAYACCGLESETDKDGVLTQYLYDGLKRRVGSQRLGITHTNELDAAGRVVVERRLGTDQTAIVLRQADYDTAGRQTLETNALGGVTVYAAETVDPATGQRTRSMTNPDLGTRVETRSRDGSLKSVSGTAAYPVRYEYGAETGGRTWVKEYRINGASESEWIKRVSDMAGRLVEIQYAPGTAFHRFHYNALGQLAKEVDPTGVTTFYDYNGKGERTKTTLDLNEDGLQQDSPTDRMTEVIASTLTDHGCTVQRVETRLTPPGGGARDWVTREDASADGLHRWLIVRNGAGTLTTETVTAYLGNGQRAETTIAPDGSRTVRTYQSGRLASAATQTASAATLTQTTYAYDSHGRVWSETDLRNGATTYLYNAADQVIRATTPAPAAGQETLVTLYEYDRMGRGTQVVLPGAPLPVPPYYTFNLWTNFSIRNARGELILQYGAGVQAAGFAYDDQGRLERMTNWLVIPYHGRPVDIANGVQVTRWDYDSSRGWLSHKYDPSDWNGASRATGIEHRYDLSGRPSQRIWGRGVTTTYGYIAGELHSIAYSDGLTPNVTFARDSRGRITNAVSMLGGTVVDRIAYAYNDAGQLLGEAHPQGVLGDFVVGSGFSAQGRRTTLGLTGNGASYGVTFAPGPGSRLSRVTYGDAITDYEYAPSSALVEKTKHRVGTSERLVTARAYDAVNRLTNIDNRVLSATHLAAGYEYYPRGQRQRTRVTDLSLEPDRESTWTYDYVANGKLWGVRHSWADGQADRGRWFSYDYKDDGNRINVWAYGGRGPSAVIPNPRNEVDSRYNYGYVAALGVANADASVSANYVPLERHNRAFAGSIQIANQNGPVYTEVKVSAVYTNSQVLHGDPRPVLIPKYFETNGVELAYDWDGNPTRDSLWQYTWDGENRLIRMTTQLPNSALPAKRIEFQYDWQGRRIAKRVYDSAVGGNEVTSLFLYDGWNLIAQANGSKQLTKTFVWGTDLSGTEQGAGGVGGLLMVDDRASGAGLHFVGYEGNGNVALLVHAGYGTVNGQYEYGPYGEPIRGTEYMAKLNPFRFSTKYTDDETGLLYYGYRYYSPSLGRWLSRDPIEEEGGVNLYEFCGNDPVNGVDVLGLAKCDLKGIFAEMITKKVKNQIAHWGMKKGFVNVVKRYGVVAGIEAVSDGPLPVGDVLAVGTAVVGIIDGGMSALQLREMIADLNFFEKSLEVARDQLSTQFENCFEQRPKCCEKAKDLFRKLAQEIEKPKKRGQFRRLLAGTVKEAILDIGKCCVHCPPKGFAEVKDPPFYSHNQPVYRKGNVFISPDVDSHKGGVWKLFDHKGNRLGTADENLSPFAP